MLKSTFFVSVISTLLFSHTYAANDEFIFATAPTHSAEATQKMYIPIINYLSAKTGKNFKLDLPKSFIEYSSRMQKNQYDMVFDGPHLSGWRMDRQQHTPIVKLPGQIKIVIAVREKSILASMDDIQYGVRVCSFTPPNLLTMALLSYFPNPSKQPNLIRVQGFKKLIQCLKTNQGDAAVLRDKLWEKAQKSGEAKGLKLIAQPTKGYPERTFTTGPKIDAKLREQISQLLLSEEGQEALAPMLQNFKKEKLIKADPDEYIGLGNLISTVWGFE